MYSVEMPSKLSSVLGVMEITVSLGLHNLAAPFSCIGMGGFEGILLFWIVAPFCAVTVWTLFMAAVLTARRCRTGASAGNVAHRKTVIH